MFRLDLSNIDPKFNNIIVLDDLMDLALDSPIISKLFTQGGLLFTFPMFKPQLQSNTYLHRY